MLPLLPPKKPSKFPTLTLWLLREKRSKYNKNIFSIFLHTRNNICSSKKKYAAKRKQTFCCVFKWMSKTRTRLLRPERTLTEDAKLLISQTLKIQIAKLSTTPRTELSKHGQLLLYSYFIEVWREGERTLAGTFVNSA